MEVLHYPDDVRPPRLVHPVLALGNFDGLHRGHLKIIERVKRGAAERGGTPMAMTFDPHPPRVVRPDKAPPLLMTKEQKLEALNHAGVAAVAVVRFTPEISRWEPETFVRSVLVEWLRVSEVWVGANFLFGHARSGNFTLLRTLGQRYGFRAEKIDPVRYKDFVVSSTRIRRLVAEARMDEAGALLGHPYYLDGVIVEGKKRGREIGFPTANLRTANELIPPHGVYATTLAVDRVVHAAVTSIGVNPTFGDLKEAAIETHVLNLRDSGFGIRDSSRELPSSNPESRTANPESRVPNPDLYGRRVRLGFVQRLRDERHFEDVDALRTQIDADVRRAERLFSRLSV